MYHTAVFRTAVNAVHSRGSLEVAVRLGATRSYFIHPSSTMGERLSHTRLSRPEGAALSQRDGPVLERCVWARAWPARSGVGN
jgi:hypothetical protein